MVSQSVSSGASPVLHASSTFSRPTNQQSSSSSPITGLKHNLKGARLEENHETDYKYFVPISALRRLVRPDTVQQYLLHVYPTMKPDEAKDWAQRVCTEEKAMRLFASLAYIKKGGAICGLLGEGLSDEGLPFRKNKGSKASSTGLLSCKEGKSIQLFQSWLLEDLQKLGEEHFMMMAPIFQQGEDYGEFVANTPLPFVGFEDSSTFPDADRGKGGYSEVFKKKIHPAHHNFDFGPAKNFVAVKRLNNPNTDNFDRELRNLRKLDPKHHPHIVTLLSTFKHMGKHHLIFPWANSNLMQYWKARPTGPQPDNVLSARMWAINQMQGIASGLALIHEFRSTFETAPSTIGIDQTHREKPARCTEGEKPYGRHGDIKPENILWFQEHSASNDPLGILQIADLGLGRFHSRESRSAVNPSAAQATLTYEPPECQLKQFVSRKYDIWSLGCVLLEWVTWLLKGYHALEEFSEMRDKPSRFAPECSEDRFFQIDGPSERMTAASVANGVKKWVAILHSEPNTSQMIHDLLGLIMDKMLVVDKNHRITARKLKEGLRELEIKAAEDEGYVLKPVAYISEVPNRRPGLLRPASTWSTPSSSVKIAKDRRWDL